MTYQVVKRYGHEEGWSCTFRQHKADHSHCKFIHGYAMAFEFVFECETLDARDWCYDFGGLKQLKAWLQDTFDHKMLVAQDDPELHLFMQMQQAGIADITWVPAVGCEKFAEMAWMQANHFLQLSGEQERVHLASVKVAEHLGNSAIFHI